MHPETIGKARIIVGACVGCIVLAVAATASAHHSGAMYDADKEVMIKGVVKEWRYQNPHSWLFVVINEPGKPEVEWRFEGPNAGTAIRRGLYRDSIMPGQVVTVAASPRKDGLTEGNLRSVTFENGTVLSLGGPPGARRPAGAGTGAPPAASNR